MAENSISGYRPGTERTASKMYSTKSMELKPSAAKAQADLYKAVWDATDKFAVGKGPAVPCVLNPDEFISDELKTDREAQLACAGCPALDLCRQYAEAAHPSWGILGGVQYGRALAEAMKEGEDES